MQALGQSLRHPPKPRCDDINGPEVHDVPELLPVAKNPALLHQLLHACDPNGKDHCISRMAGGLTCCDVTSHHGADAAAIWTRLEVCH